MSLVYRKEPPDEPGGWWVIDSANVEQLVDVCEYIDRNRGGEKRLVAFEHGVGGFVELRQLHAVMWAGPVPRPVKP